MFVEKFFVVNAPNYSSAIMSYGKVASGFEAPKESAFADKPSAENVLKEKSLQDEVLLSEGRNFFGRGSKSPSSQSLRTGASILRIFFSHSVRGLGFVFFDIILIFLNLTSYIYNIVQFWAKVKFFEHFSSSLCSYRSSTYRNS